MTSGMIHLSLILTQTSVKNGWSEVTYGWFFCTGKRPRDREILKGHQKIQAPLIWIHCVLIMNDENVSEREFCFLWDPFCGCSFGEEFQTDTSGITPRWLGSDGQPEQREKLSKSRPVSCLYIWEAGPSHLLWFPSQPMKQGVFPVSHFLEFSSNSFWREAS